MKILHTSDLHIGQTIYQHYDRVDEHLHFFAQLKKWCQEEKPDALLVSGDVFDIQQPSASVKEFFNEQFIKLNEAYPEMKIVVTAGNHDSPSRLNADKSLWSKWNLHLVSVAPSVQREGNWMESYIVRLPQGYIVAVPYAVGERTDFYQEIFDYIAKENVDNKPVVAMGHLSVTGMDATGHDFIGTIKKQEISSLGTGYDYFALGHIHCPQTIGHHEDKLNLDEVVYPSGVVRYSGSALHVSCDEAYPHTVSVVEIEQHGGNVKLRQLRIDELRHFYELPLDKSQSFTDENDILSAIDDFCKKNERGYFRLRVDYKTQIAPNFNQKVYELLMKYNNEVRYNPKILWTGKEEESNKEKVKPTFEVAELQQMTDPMQFIERIISRYSDLNLEEVRKAFEEVKEEVHRMDEEEQKKEKSSKKTKKQEENQQENE